MMLLLPLQVRLLVRLLPWRPLTVAVAAVTTCDAAVS